MSQNGRNELQIRSTSQEAGGLPLEKGTTQIQSPWVDTVIHMDTTQEERLTIAKIARKLEEKGQPKAMIRL